MGRYSLFRESLGRSSDHRNTDRSCDVLDREEAIIQSATSYDRLRWWRSSRLAGFAFILLELALIAVLVGQFRIEASRHLLPVLCFIIAGFVVHAWLPARFRLPCFAALSLGLVLFLLGLKQGLAVIAVATTLIGICYFPIPIPYRVLLLIAATAGLAWFRVRFPFPFWPIVGSMFMFRIVSFLSECRREKKNPTLVWAIAYFFLLPNACFPFFPIVDFKTFRSVRYDDDEWQIYQRGVEWITRGLMHLLIYRALKSYLVPGPHELYDFAQIALFTVTNYCLYLQVSGQFHLITGLLHLFGFNLPQTHNRYFLASSLSEIWRRINIYWKDFLAKFVFYPVFYTLRSRGASVSPAIVVSVFAVFLSTWLLHSWQTFWLLGQFPLTINDACLWLGAGCLVAINALVETRRTERTQSSSLMQALIKSVRTVAVFVLVSVFWSCWTKPGFPSLVVESLRRPESYKGVLQSIATLAIAVAIGTMVALISLPQKMALNTGSRFDFNTSVKIHLAGLCLILALGSPGISSIAGARFVQTLREFRDDPTIALGAGERLQSYYEDLNSAPVQAGPLLSALSLGEPPPNRPAEGFLKISRRGDVYQGIELIPGLRTQLDAQAFSTNEFGMRDRDSLSFAKPANTVRIALVGSSIVMGYGVSDDEVFARRFETQLNDELGSADLHFQVLNFGVGKQWAPHRLIRIQRRVLSFHPDVLFYFAHQDEFKELANHAAQLVTERRALPSAPIQAVVSSTGATSSRPAGEILSRLSRYEKELLLANYQTIVELCQSRDVIPVWIYLPVPGETADEIRDRLLPLATSAGFIVCDLSDWTEGATDLFPSNDFHPNARGHLSISHALLRLVKSRPDIVPRPIALNKTETAADPIPDGQPESSSKNPVRHLDKP